METWSFEMGRDSPLGEARARYTASVISGQATEILKDEYISWNIGFADTIQEC